MPPLRTLLLLTVALTVASSGAADTPSYYPSAEAAAAAHCEDTLFPDLCVSTLSTVHDLQKKLLPEVITSAVNRTEDAVRNSASNCSTYLNDPGLTARDRVAIGDCMELFDTTLDELQAAASDLEPAADAKSASATVSRACADHVMTVLSAAITNQFTCLEGFADHNNPGKILPYIKPRLHQVYHMVSNSLAMAKKLPQAPGGGSPAPPVPSTSQRKPFVGYGQMVKGFPTWVKAGDRRLLQTSVGNMTVDAVVAKDGSGQYTTVSAAVAAAPTKSSRRYVIHIKAGAYLENVEVGKHHQNLMFVGDGIGKTVIKASRNVVDGSTTFRSATVAVVGNGFLARDITIENSAGPSKHQAVALRVGADLSAFYRCSFVGNQDTLYTHSLRQFFRDCDIYGTIDFIFGNAAVVLQNCNLYARRPLPNQNNIYTAQGREDPNQNTGISIQKCKVTAASDLAPVQSSFKTYLGRPWKKYSRTVYLQSYLDSLINPAGWLEWNGSFALDTLYYGEYQNNGPGAATTNRVKWKGYRVITSASEASTFTVGSFIDGDQWLGATNVPFNTGL